MQPTIELITSFAGSANIAFLHADLVSEVVALRDAAVEKDWGQVRCFAVRALGLGNAAARLAVIEARTTRSRHVASKTAAVGLDAILADAITPALADALDRLESGGPLSFEPVSAAFGDVPTPSLGGIRMTLDMALAAQVRGLLGLVHADLNLTLAAADPEDNLTDLIGL